MVINNNPYTFARQAMAALRLTFPDGKVRDQQFNNEFEVEFDGGKIGYCGTVNGPLECNMYWSREHLEAGTDPCDTVSIASVYDQKVIGYEGVWTVEGGVIVLECGSMSIMGDKLYVGIGSGDYHVATGEVPYLKSMANKYLQMLDAVTSTGMVDGPDVLLLPETMKLKFAKNKEDRWGEEQCFHKCIRDM